MKILIIDDEPLVRRALLKAFSRKENVILFEADDGESGIKLWKSEKPDFIFLDVLMPGKSGIQVLKELRGDRSGKVILMSAYSGEEDIESYRDVEFDRFLAKPFENIFETIKVVEELG